MGLLVADEMKFDNGITASNFVISIKGSVKEIFKQTDYTDPNNLVVVYSVWYVAYYWVSLDAYNNKVQPFYERLCRADLTEVEVSGNVFQVIYNKIAAGFVTTTEC